MKWGAEEREGEGRKERGREGEGEGRIIRPVCQSPYWLNNS